MKTKISLSIASISLFSVLAFHSVSEKKDKQNTSLFIENIEALANNEADVIDCPGGSTACAKVIVDGQPKEFFKK